MATVSVMTRLFVEFCLICVVSTGKYLPSAVLFVTNRHKPACTVPEAGWMLEMILDLSRRGIALCSENKGAYQLCGFVFAQAFCWFCPRCDAA